MTSRPQSVLDEARESMEALALISYHGGIDGGVWYADITEDGRYADITEDGINSLRVLLGNLVEQLQTAERERDEWKERAILTHAEDARLLEQLQADAALADREIASLKEQLEAANKEREQFTAALRVIRDNGVPPTFGGGHRAAREYARAALSNPASVSDD